MDLNVFNNKSKAQVTVLIAIIVSIAVISGATIRINEQTLSQITPEATNNEEPSAIAMVEDYNRIAGSIVASRNNADISGVTANLQDAEQAIQTGSKHQAATINVDNIATDSGQQISDPISAGTTNIDATDYIAGGIAFDSDGSSLVETTTPTSDNAFRLKIERPTGNVSIYVYNDTSTSSDVDAYVESESGVQLNAYEVDTEDTNKIDIGVGKINGYRITNSEYNSPEEVTLANGGNIDGDIDMVSSSFAGSDYTPDTTDITYAVSYDITVETPTGKITQSDTAYHSPIVQ